MSQSERVPLWVRWVVWLIAPLALGLLAVELGFAFSWDARNYHYYNGFALLEGRMGHDIAPAARQTFHNPVLDVPFYLVYQHLARPWPGFLLGSLHGLNIPLLFLLAWTVIRHPTATTARALTALAAVVAGVLHTSFLVEVGGAAQDNVVSLFVLAALVILARSLRAGNLADRAALARILAAGCLLGAATGLKPTAAIFCVGAVLAVGMLPGSSWGTRGRWLVALALGGVIGAAATGGFWAVRMARLTGNPLFPYLNQLFRSDLVAPKSFEYRGFLTTDTIFWGDPDVINEELWALRTLCIDDFRYLTVFVLLLAALAVRFVRGRLDWSTVVDHRAGVLLAWFFIGSFTAWLKIFAIHRYMLALGLIVPILIVFLFESVVPFRRVRALTFALIGVVLIAGVTLETPKRVPWDPDPFRVDLAGSDIGDDALVVMIDWAPTSYVIPEFPAGARFVRPVGNLYLRPHDRLYEIITSTIRNHRGPLYTLHARESRTEEQRQRRLDQLGLVQRRDSCIPLRNQRIIDRLVLCPATRRPDARSAPTGRPRTG